MSTAAATKKLERGTEKPVAACPAGRRNRRRKEGGTKLGGATDDRTSRACGRGSGRDSQRGAALYIPAVHTSAAGSALYRKRGRRRARWRLGNCTEVNSADAQRVATPLVCSVRALVPPPPPPVLFFLLPPPPRATTRPRHRRVCYQQQIPLLLSVVAVCRSGLRDFGEERGGGGGGAGGGSVRAGRVVPLGSTPTRKHALCPPTTRDARSPAGAAPRRLCVPTHGCALTRWRWRCRWRHGRQLARQRRRRRQGGPCARGRLAVHPRTALGASGGGGAGWAVDRSSSRCSREARSAGHHPSVGGAPSGLPPRGRRTEARAEGNTKGPRNGCTRRGWPRA